MIRVDKGSSHLSLRSSLEHASNHLKGWAMLFGLQLLAELFARLVVEIHVELDFFLGRKLKSCLKARLQTKNYALKLA